MRNVNKSVAYVTGTGRRLPPEATSQGRISQGIVLALCLFMVALCNRADHNIFMLFLLLSFFFFSSFYIGDNCGRPR